MIDPVSLASRAWKQSEVNRNHACLNEWATAFAASKVVGKYGRGATAELAARCGTSEDTIQRLAAAWVIYARLRHTDALRAKKLRKTHGYMRFVDLGALWVRYEFDVDKAFEYLESGLSNAAMEMQIIDIHDPLPEWHRKGISFYSTIGKWITDVNIPSDIREAAQNFYDRLARLTV